MKGKLERFVRDNREDFDRLEPRTDLWNAIEKGLGPSSTTGPARSDAFEQNGQGPGGQSVSNGIIRLRGFRSWGAQRMWHVAASVSVLVGLAAGFWYFNTRYGVTEQPEVVAVSPTYARQFTQYTRLIDDKRAELKTLTASNPALYEQFATELDRLEHGYQNLKQELPKTPNQEVLIRAMVQNLQTQIDLLNQQLMIIERIKQQTNEPQKALI